MCPVDLIGVDTEVITSCPSTRSGSCMRSDYVSALSGHGNHGMLITHRTQVGGECFTGAGEAFSVQ
jgi:hypothetical protein